MKENLYQKLINYAKSDIYPFCMPGHKRNFLVPGLVNPYDIDITEVEGFDNLHDPNGIIRDMEERLKEVYAVAGDVLMSVNGSSAGLLAAVSAVPKGGELLIARNCHKSVFDAVSIGGRKVHYLYPEEIVPDSMIFGGIDPQTVEAHLKRNSRIRGVVITSPTYEGFLSDVKSIAEICHNYGALLIVDEAHGAHLPYHKSFPMSAIYLDADIVVQSLHKTLPSLNQTALIFVNKDPELTRRVRRMLSAFTTTSPSYGLLASIEFCVEWCVDNEANFETYVKSLTDIRGRCKALSTILLLGEELKGRFGIFAVDPSKLVFLTDKMPGNDLFRYFLNEHRLQMEAAGPIHVIAMTSVADTEKGFRRLSQALEAADRIQSYPKNPEYSDKQMKQIALAYVQETGTIFKDFIYLYPPGCPIIAPGEMYTKEVREKILSWIDMGLEVIEWERSTF